MYVCVCVCVREAERERELCVCVCVRLCAYRGSVELISKPKGFFYVQYVLTCRVNHIFHLSGETVIFWAPNSKLPADVIHPFQDCSFFDGKMNINWALKYEDFSCHMLPRETNEDGDTFVCFVSCPMLLQQSLTLKVTYKSVSIVS